MDVTEINPSKMKKKGLSALEIALIVLAVLLAAIAIAMIIAYATYDDGICKTPSCVNAASRIMTSMDATANPCQDFYQYSCGGWLKKNVIPDSAPRFSTIDQLKDIGTDVLKSGFETKNDSDNSAIKKVKVFYQSCLNETSKNLKKGQPLIKALADVFDWPVTMDNWEEVYGATWTAESAMSRMNAKFGSENLINAAVSKDVKESSVFIVYIDQPAMQLPSAEYYTCTGAYEKACEAYLVYMTTLAKLIRQDKNLAVDENKIKAELARSFELEKAIINAFIPPEIKQDPNNVYEKMSIAEVENKYPVTINGTKFNWLSYINAVLAPSKVTVTNSEQVIMFCGDYIKNITNFISKFSGRDIQNLFAWTFVKSVAGDLSSEYKDAGKAINQVFYGSSGDVPIWKTCTTFCSNNFNDVAGRIYVEETFSSDSKALVNEMISEIRTSFLEMLEEQTWMDEITKQKAALKASKIREQIGFPDVLFNDAEMEKTYSELNFKSEEYFENKLQFLTFVQVLRGRKLREKPDPNEWAAGAAEVNAYYSASDNLIVFPAGILQPPMFFGGGPKSLNYGGIGSVIGHEITHGFDNNGKNYDEKGDLVDWWTENSLQKFNGLSQCFVDQYGNFSWALAGGRKLSGTGTLGENIADNGGIREAYKAYMYHIKKNGKEKNLPGLDLTNEQLFFLSFGQIWCATYTPEYAVTSITEDEHSPGQFRVIGTLQNTQEFSDAFSCRSNDNMNPKHKCRVW
ncbi:neprilysin-like isoform X2 [Bombina bombina]|nr:neprilysin-like isoform X2 [Bombina bombina]